MEWNTLFQLIHSCTDCNTSLITGIEQLSAHFQEHIFFQSRQSVDCTLFFQQILEDKKPGELCCITDSYHIYTCVVLLPKETFIILGPYLLEKPSHTFINKISTKNKNTNFYASFLETLLQSDATFKSHTNSVYFSDSPFLYRTL